MKRGININIRIEKKHIYLLAFIFSFLGVFIVIGATPFDPNLGWHPLQQIATDETGTASVDANSNAIIDKAENISLTDGRASVGDGTTDSILEIRGKTTEYSSIDFYSGSTNEWGIGKDTDGNFYVDKSGVGNKVLIDNNMIALTGNLNLTGDLKLGNSGTSCSSSNEGALRYNSAAKTMEYCNSTDWKELGGGTGEGSDEVAIVNGDHTGTECSDAGGIPIDIGGGEYVCKFVGASCATGWTPYEDWSTTYYRNCGNSCSSCNTPEHQYFANLALETCTYRLMPPGCGGWTGYATCYATIQEIGCY